MFALTRKVGGITILFLLAIAIILITAIGAAYAEPVAVDEGTCEFNAQGDMQYDGPIKKPCTLMLDTKQPGFLYFQVKENGTTTTYRWDINKKTGEKLTSI